MKNKILNTFLVLCMIVLFISATTNTNQKELTTIVCNSEWNAKTTLNKYISNGYRLILYQVNYVYYYRGPVSEYLIIVSK